LVLVSLRAVALVPEVRLHLADESTDLWRLAGGGYSSDEPPPFWAFAWAGGQALARYILDNPELVAGHRVIDVASGSGLVAIAAAKAGAVHVTAVDVDPAAVAAAARNAHANGTTIAVAQGDPLAAATARVPDAGPAHAAESSGPAHADVSGAWTASAAAADVVLAGDACYTEALGRRLLAFARRAARDGATVFIGDPDRGFLPHAGLRLMAGYDVPTPGGLEDRLITRTHVWAVTRPPARR
jgi:predicted nicotinamide N-methyase